LRNTVQRLKGSGFKVKKADWFGSYQAGKPGSLEAIRLKGS
jgi:hypothetical protein